MAPTSTIEPVDATHDPTEDTSRRFEMRIHEVSTRLGRIAARTAAGLVAIGATTAGVADARDFQVNCDRGRTIQRTLDRAQDGDRILVRGACTETLVVRSSVVIDGGGVTSIAPARPEDTTITVERSTVELRGLVLDAPAFIQIAVTKHADVVIDGNEVRSASSDAGILITENSNAIVTANLVERNTGNGIVVTGGSTARIGFARRAGVDLQPNTIRANGQRGIASSANAAISVAGNEISDNDLDGIVVSSGSSASIGGNDISGHRFGIVLAGATVSLGTTAQPDPPSRFTPNSGLNDVAGVACLSGEVLGEISPLGGSIFGPGVAFRRDPATLLILPLRGGPVVPPAPITPTDTFCNDRTLPPFSATTTADAIDMPGS